MITGAVGVPALIGIGYAWITISGLKWQVSQLKSELKHCTSERAVIDDSRQRCKSASIQFELDSQRAKEINRKLIPGKRPKNIKRMLDEAAQMGTKELK